jgi:hypothetical protein
MEKSEFKNRHGACRKLYVDYDKKINDSYEEKNDRPELRKTDLPTRVGG